MRKLIRGHRILAFGVIGLVATVVAAGAGASTVYSWTTEDGTESFTDDPARIPSRYKKTAEKRTVGTLKNYPRLSVSQMKTDLPYEERIQARLADLRGQRAPAVSAGPPLAVMPGARIDLGLGTNDNHDQVSLPIAGADDEEPITISRHRIRARDSIATQNMRVMRRGDEVIAVSVSKRNEGPISETGIGQRGAGAPVSAWLAPAVE